MKNPYEVLGVTATASDEEIRKAYRELAKKNHPDLHPDDSAAENRFKEISAANSLLSDPEKRAQFDRGEIDASGAERQDRSFYREYGDGAGSSRYSPFGADGPGNYSAEDIFAEVFGQQARGKAQTGFHMRGGDISYTLRCPFLDAVNGALIPISLPDGRTLKVTVPKGTRDRQTLRLKGQGKPGIGGGEAGDAFIEIHIEPHAFFNRKDENIHLEVPITLKEAVLGGKIRVPTIDGFVDLTVPAGSNTQTTLRLRGKGVLRGDGIPRGDQYVTLNVVLPKEPDNQLQEFLQNWEPSEPYDVRATEGMTG